jgi:hypothetical protein
VGEAKVKWEEGRLEGKEVRLYDKCLNGITIGSLTKKKSSFAARGRRGAGAAGRVVQETETDDDLPQCDLLSRRPPPRHWSLSWDGQSGNGNER